MIVAIEGMKCTGKTMFAKWLAEDLATKKINVELVKGRHTENSWESIALDLVILGKSNRVYVFDEFYGTEFVLNTHLEKYPIDDMITNIERLESLIEQSPDVHFVGTILQCSSQTLKKRHSATGRNFEMGIEKSQMLWDAFLDITDQHYVSDNNNVDEMTDGLATLLKIIKDMRTVICGYEGAFRVDYHLSEPM